MESKFAKGKFQHPVYPKVGVYTHNTLDTFDLLQVRFDLWNKRRYPLMAFLLPLVVSINCHDTGNEIAMAPTRLVVSNGC